MSKIRFFPAVTGSYRCTYAIVNCFVVTSDVRKNDPYLLVNRIYMFATKSPLYFVALFSSEPIRKRVKPFDTRRRFRLYLTKYVRIDRY